MAFEMDGEFVLPASREEVWRALNDPDVLCRCIQGCETMEQIGDNTFKANVKMKIGPVSSVFSGVVDLVDLDPPNSYRIEGKGDGGAAGFAKGGAKVTLSDAEGGTLLCYDVNADIGGKLSQLGGRLINGVAKRQADQFFANFADEFARSPVDDRSIDKPEPDTSAPAKTGASTIASPPRRQDVQTVAAPMVTAWPLLIALAVAVFAGFLIGRSTADPIWVGGAVVLAVVSAGVGFRAGRGQ